MCFLYCLDSDCIVSILHGVVYRSDTEGEGVDSVGLFTFILFSYQHKDVIRENHIEAYYFVNPLNPSGFTAITL